MAATPTEVRHKSKLWPILATGLFGLILLVVTFTVLIFIQWSDGTTMTVRTDDDAKIVINTPSDGVMTFESLNPSTPPSELECLQALRNIGALVTVRSPDGTIATVQTIDQFVPGSRIVEVRIEPSDTVTDQFFRKFIAPLTELSSLCIFHSPNLLDHHSFFKQIGKLEHLRYLVASLPLDDADAIHVARCQKLEILTAGEARFSVAGSTELTKLKRLRDCGFTFGTSTDGAFVPFVEQMRLETISFRALPINGSFLEGKDPLPSIQSCDFTGTQFNDETLAHLSRLTNLRSLTMETGPINGSGLIHLQNASNLSHLNFHGCKITNIGGLSAIARLPRLTSLNLHACPIDDSGFEAIVAAQPKQLTWIDAAWTKITDRGVAALVTLPNLQTLDLFNVDVSSDGFAELAKSESLQKLSLGSPKLDDAVIQTLADRKTNLQALWIHQNSLTDNCVADLSRMTSLTELKFFESHLSDDAINRLKEALPGATVTIP